MDDDRPPPKRIPLHRLTLACSLALGAIGAFVLIGGLFGLYPFYWHEPAMRPLTAVLFLLLAATFFAIDSEGRSRLSTRTVGVTVIVATALFSVLPRIGLLPEGWVLGPLTTVIFALTGLALLVRCGHVGGFCTTEWLGLVIAVLSGSAVLAELFDVQHDSPIFGMTGTAPETGVAGMLVAMLLAAAAPRGHLLALFRDSGPGGRILRRLLPIPLFLLPALAWLRLKGEDLGLYGTREGVVYLVTLAFAAVIVIATLAAAGVRREDLARRAEEVRRREQAVLLDSIIRGSGDAIFVKDAEGRYLLANPAMLSILGLDESEVLGHTDAEFLSPDEAGATHGADKRVMARGETLRIEETFSFSGNEERVLLTTRSPLRAADGSITGVISVAHEVTEQRRLQRAIDWQTTHDTLTGLANRSLLRDRLAQALPLAERRNLGVALLALDLDMFKRINEDLSYAAGDLLLAEIGRRIVSCVRGGDSVARVYGDEFVIVLSEVEGRAWVEEVVRRIIAAVAVPWRHGDDEVVLGASIGVSLFPVDAKDANELERNAEVAMHRAKELGKNRYEFYELAVRSDPARRIDRERDLRHALESGELVLHYQPKVDIRSGMIAGAEALVRWQHPVRGLVTPGEFLPLAEDSGLIVPISEWVVREGCAAVKRWRDEGLDTGPVALNLSGRQLMDAGLAARLATIIGDSGAAHGAIELEVTETSVLRDQEETARILYRFHEMGIKLALDDFGTGYSSLAFLRKFPISCLKIDRSFVRDIHTDPGDAAIARTVIAMAHALKLYAIAEGVETGAQLRYLHHHGCDQFQGYLFSQAVPAEEFVAMVAEGRTLDLEANGISTRHTLLLVDDEEGVLSALKRLFRRDGYRILTASSGNEALRVLAEEDVQVIISDQRMSGMSGAELLGHITDLYPDTIRIMLTGYTQLDAVIDSVNRGAIWKFLTKPWEDTSLREQVRDAFLQHEAKYGR